MRIQKQPEYLIYFCQTCSHGFYSKEEALYCEAHNHRPWSSKKGFLDNRPNAPEKPKTTHRPKRTEAPCASPSYRAEKEPNGLVRIFRDDDIPMNDGIDPKNRKYLKEKLDQYNCKLKV